MGAAQRAAEDATTVLWHPLQHDNPMLKCFGALGVTHREEASLAPDFAMGSASCAVVVGQSRHRSAPKYIEARMRAVPPSAPYRLRVCIVVKDDKGGDVEEALLSLTMLALAHGWTLLVASDARDAAYLLAALRQYEHKGLEQLEALASDDPRERAASALMCVKAVNSTDAALLLEGVGSLADIFAAGPEELAAVSGIGDVKVRQMIDAFRTPFCSAGEKRGAGVEGGVDAGAGADAAPLQRLVNDAGGAESD